MKIKGKLMIFLVILLVLLSLGSVAATDVADNTAVVNETLNLNQLQDTGIDSLNSENLGAVMNNENNQLNDASLGETNPAQGTFNDLAKLIAENTNGTIVLDRDYINPEFSSFSSKGIIINKTITIDGAGHSIDANKNSRIFTVDNSVLTLKDITLKNANYVGNGGAIANEKGNVNLICIGNVIFTDNTVYSQSTVFGGAIYANNNVKINCTGNLSFINNGAVHGGSICANKGNVNLIFNGNVIFKGNSGSAGSSGFGYGCNIYSIGGNVNIKGTGNAEFSNNGNKIYMSQKGHDAISGRDDSYLNGGAIATKTGDIIINITGDLLFKNNRIGDTALIGFGSAIFAEKNLKITANKVEFSNNYAKQGQTVYAGKSININAVNGVTFANNNDANTILVKGAVTISNASFINNRCNNVINAYGGSIVNSTFIGNHNIVGINNVYKNCKLTVLVNNKSSEILYAETNFNLTAKLVDSRGNTYYTSGLTYQIMHNGSVVKRVSANNLFNAISDLDVPGYYNVTATYKDPNKKITNYSVTPATVKIEEKVLPENSFTALDQLIQTSDVISLEHNYVIYNNELGKYAKGITINKNITINGNGFAIDARGMARIFNVVGGTLTIDNVTLQNGKAKNGGAIYLDVSNAVISNCNFYNNTATKLGGAIYVNGDNNVIRDCDFQYNNAPKGTVIGFNKGDNLIVAGNTNVDNSSAAEIYLKTNKTTLSNVDIVVLGNSTVAADYGESIILTAVVTSGGLTVDGNALRFSDGYKFIKAKSLGNGTYAAKYNVKFEDYRTITAQFNKALNENLYSGVIDSRVIDLTVNDISMYYKNGQVVAELFVNGQPFAGETIQMTINGVTYNLTTNDQGLAILPIGLNAGDYDVYTIYNLTYRYVDANSTLTVLNTITGEDISLYFQDGSKYSVKVVDGAGRAVANQVVRMNINGAFYDCLTNAEGIASLVIGLNADTYTITTENLANGEKISNTITVLPTVTGEDLIMYERNGSSYSVQVLNKDGSLAKNAHVSMNINGVFYDVTTNDEGIAFLTINLNAGEYIVTTEYEGFKISNKINVLPVLVGNDTTLYYCNGTNYTVKVLDGTGNPLSNVTVCMNINGVVYDRISNADGVASLPIELYPGNYIVTTTYKDHTTSNNVTVLPVLKTNKAVI